MASPETPNIQIVLEGAPKSPDGIFDIPIANMPFVRQFIEMSGVSAPTEALRDEYIYIKPTENSDIYRDVYMEHGETK